MTYWKEYWEKLDEPLQRFNTEEWCQFYARELMLYFPEKRVSALELGCGNGALYGSLKQRFSYYTGVDFSPAMLAKFKSHWPDVNLICADISCLPLNDYKYDLIFSNGVCQYLDQEMLRNKLTKIRRILNSSGVYLIGNIPDTQLRLFYYAGALRSDRESSWRVAASSLANILLKKTSDGIGQWYSRRTISKLASEHGFTCQTFSSSSHEYRFHAVLRNIELQS